MQSRSGTDFECHIPPPSEEGADEVISAMDLALKTYQRSLANARRRHAKIVELLEQNRQQLRDHLGSETVEALGRFSASQRASHYGLGNLATEPNAPVRLASARAQISSEAAALMNKMHIDASALRDVRARLQAGVHKVGTKVPRAPGRLEFVPEANVPREIRRRKTNPWSVRTLPFDGWEWWYAWDWYGDFGDPTYTHYTDHVSGSVGHRSDWDVNDAGEADYGHLELHSSVGFWMKPTQAGKVEMWIRTRCGRARYALYAFDEVGWSHYNDTMRSYWTINLTSGTADEDSTLCWEMNFIGPNQEEKSASGDIVSANTAGWLHLTTSDAVPANKWLFVKFGTFDLHALTADDMTMDSVMRNRWYLEEVQYRTI
jgi:hypothetical protein